MSRMLYQRISIVRISRWFLSSAISLEIIRCPVIETDTVYIPDWDKHNTVFDS